MKKIMKWKTAGFTLVEVIITVVVIGIVGAMIVSVMGKSMTHSSEPISRLQKTFALQQVVENFVTAYEKYYAGDLDGLKASITAGETNPATYGSYTIVENQFIKFVSNVEQQAGDTDTHDLLKVTIKNSNNETLTYIFAG